MSHYQQLPFMQVDNTVVHTRTGITIAVMHHSDDEVIAKRVAIHLCRFDIGMRYSGWHRPEDMPRDALRKAIYAILDWIKDEEEQKAIDELKQGEAWKP